MKNSLAVGVAAFLIVSTGLVHAYWTGMFGKVNENERLKEFADRIKDVPVQVGDWVGVDQEAIDAREREVAGVDAAISRTYTNRITGETVGIFLASGYFRNVAQHTPNQCFPAAGYVQKNKEIQYVVPVGDESVTAYTTVFELDDTSGTKYQRVFWTWSYDGTWQAPDVPRLALAGQPALYKMYLITELAQPGASIEQNPSIKFLNDFLPVLNAALFPSASSATSDVSAPTEASTTSESQQPAKADD